MGLEKTIEQRSLNFTVNDDLLCIVWGTGCSQKDNSQGEVADAFSSTSIDQNHEIVVF